MCGAIVAMAGGVVLVSAGYDQRVLLWDVRKGKPWRSIAHDASVRPNNPKLKRTASQRAAAHT